MKNLVILIGRLGKDPETRHLDSGKSVTTMTVATNTKRKDRTGQLVEETEWNQVVLWGNASQFAERYLKKGELVCVEGTLKTRSWEKDGVKKYTTEVHAFKIQKLGNQQSQASQEQPTQEQSTDGIEDDDLLPF